MMVMYMARTKDNYEQYFYIALLVVNIHDILYEWMSGLGIGLPMPGVQHHMRHTLHVLIVVLGTFQLMPTFTIDHGDVASSGVIGTNSTGFPGTPYHSVILDFCRCCFICIFFSSFGNHGETAIVIDCFIFYAILLSRLLCNVYLWTIYQVLATVISFHKLFRVLLFLILLLKQHLIIYN